MKPKYTRMPPTPKTEEDHLRLRILQLEAGVAYPKGVEKVQTSGRSQAEKLSKS